MIKVYWKDGSIDTWKQKKHKNYTYRYDGATFVVYKNDDICAICNLTEVTAVIIR